LEKKPERGDDGDNEEDHSLRVRLVVPECVSGLLHGGNFTVSAFVFQDASELRAAARKKEEVGRRGLEGMKGTNLKVSGVNGLATKSESEPASKKRVLNVQSRFRICTPVIN